MAFNLNGVQWTQSSGFKSFKWSALMSLSTSWADGTCSHGYTAYGWRKQAVGAADKRFLLEQRCLIAKNWLGWSTITINNHSKMARNVNWTCRIIESVLFHSNSAVCCQCNVFPDKAQTTTKPKSNYLRAFITLWLNHYYLPIRKKNDFTLNVL